MPPAHPQLNIEVTVIQDPRVGPTVCFNFSRRVKSFGLSDEKAEVFARFILAKVQEIRDR